MATATEARASRVFVVFNPVSGNASPEQLRQALDRHFDGRETTCEVHQTTDGEDLIATVRDAVRRGADLVVAAGGDGTVSTVAGGVVETPTPLGIIPLGTANVLARELGIPLDLDGACALLAGDHAIVRIDAVRVDDRHYYTQIGVGVDSLMILDTTTTLKRRLGSIAYVWNASIRLIGFQPRRFSLVVDDQKSRPRASQILVANSGSLGTSPFRWGQDIRIDDGRLDVCVVRARTLLDYLSLAWYVTRGQQRQARHVRYLAAERTVVIHVDRRPLPVQADGEVIGETPVEIGIVPGALGVIVPRAVEGQAAES